MAGKTEEEAPPILRPYHRAAQGDANAMRMLGIMSLQRPERPPGPQGRRQVVRKAAAAGSVGARKDLEIPGPDGRGTPVH